jgi:hypothetical protein
LLLLSPLVLLSLLTLRRPWMPSLPPLRLPLPHRLPPQLLLLLLPQRLKLHRPPSRPRPRRPRNRRRMRLRRLPLRRHQPPSNSSFGCDKNRVSALFFFARRSVADYHRNRLIGQFIER